MRVTLEVVSEPETGRKARLGAGQELRIGRTEWADFAVPHDGHMSGVHFALETDLSACYVRDLGSSNGTFVNGQLVAARTPVRTGDEILAGQTRFSVTVETDAYRLEPISSPPEYPPAIAPQAAARTMPAGVVPQTPPPIAPRPAARASYTVETCDSGLTLCRGMVEAMGPAELAGLLQQTYPLYLTVDFKRLGLPAPEELVRPDYLFDWFDPAAAALISPIVVASADLPGWPALVSAGWGADALVCLFSRQERTSLRDHLRRSLRGKARADDQAAGMIGFCWPSVMALLLSHGSKRLVQDLVGGIDAVLVELPDLPETWQIYGDGELPGVLDRLGLSAASAAPANSGAS